MNLGIIPARYNSSRFPGKPLIDISGKSMIQRVYEQSLKAALLDKVIVATDDWRIFEHVLSWGGEVSMTSSSHVTGTERCAEMAKYNLDAAIVVNIQGDEPFIDPEIIDRTIHLLKNNPGYSISTMCAEIVRADDIYDPNIVKVVFNQLKKALYFSRSPIPHVRNTPYEEWLSNELFFKHIGIYAYRHAVLLGIAQLGHGKLENAELLEQLRWLEAGYEIGIDITGKESISIDTPEDLLKIQFM